MSIPFRPLGIVRDLVQSIGFDISYAYDDLVFSDNSVFILRFDDEVQEKLYLYFNSDCNPKESEIITKRLIAEGKTVGLNITKTGLFTLKQLDNKEEIEIKFI
jgi:hypothetical protein